MLYKLLRVLAIFLFKLFFRIEIKGRKNIPLKEGIIIASNHLSNIDPIVLGVASPRRLCFLAKEELFKIPLLSSLISYLGALPLRRAQADTFALRESIKKLKRKEALVIFPEGTRLSKNKKIYAGIGFLVKKSKVKVIPSKIYNTDGVLPPGKFLPSLKKIRVIFGKPLTFSSLQPQEISKAVLEKINSL